MVKRIIWRSSGSFSRVIRAKASTSLPTRATTGSSAGPASMDSSMFLRVASSAASTVSCSALGK
jgi:hypothetical protein